MPTNVGITTIMVVIQWGFQRKIWAKSLKLGILNLQNGALLLRIYDENIDVYAGQMEGVEDLELEIPDDIEAPEEAPEISTDSGATTTASTSKDNPFGQATAQGVNDNSNNNGINANNADKDKEKDKNV